MSVQATASPMQLRVAGAHPFRRTTPLPWSCARVLLDGKAQRSQHAASIDLALNQIVLRGCFMAYDGHASSSKPVSVMIGTPVPTACAGCTESSPYPSEHQSNKQMSTPRYQFVYAIDRNRLIDDQPVQPDALNRLPKLVEVDRFLNITVRSQVVTVHEVAFFFR